ncbi:fructosamine kinase family protein [Lacticaseibacillus pabuli]|uniref:Fructosamine kinase family protein n=1 Tax=Lacticaseibacillus pabuli TaxID=3025672 RepID=A0ABY7WU09_9LACO|nr:fructosamine kinase family protein [Lacticaseibacillus sp. KACC 23028]WDF82640.1 fructosamine kinase family protein [Lacticaseibacillus sp. KACC 23028]
MLDEKWLAQLPLQDIQTAVPVGGGDVNDAYRLHADGQDYFLLVQPNIAANFYDGEIAGLAAFAKADVLAPRVLGHGQIEGDAFLLLNYLTSGSGDQADLGRLLAHLHSFPSPDGRFGFDEPYAGTSVSFDNTWVNTWQELFVGQRLDKLAAHLVQKGLWGDHEHAVYLEARAVITDELARRHSKAVLLHGDLWSGNYMFTAEGKPALIDPAALYGDREFDIGVTTVFGGFDAEFYEAYQDALPFEDGWQRRLNFYRLYYLMVHLDKFGQSYYGAVNNLLQRVLAK